MPHMMAARARRTRSRHLFRKHIDAEVEKLAATRKGLEDALAGVMKCRMWTSANVKFTGDTEVFNARAEMPHTAIRSLSKTAFTEAYRATLQVLVERLAKSITERSHGTAWSDGGLKTGPYNIATWAGGG